MKKRCNDDNTQNYKYYGGKGITYDPKWESFAGFYNDMYKSYIEHVFEFGEYNTTIERNDCDLDYNKDNCRWATWHEQFNNRTSNVIIEINGVDRSLTEWSLISNIPIETIWSRYNKGIKGEELLKNNPRIVLDKQSGVKGIRWSKKDNRWVIDKNINGHKIRLASFKENELDKAKQYFDDYIVTGEYKNTINK